MTTMDALQQFVGSISFLPGYVIPFLFVLTIVVFFHELGHFLIARWCGVTVEVFSIGFGPEIFGFTDRYGTKWKISWIPLGGYVKFLGDEDAASTPDSQALKSMDEQQRQGSFHHKSVAARSAVIVAGPFANFLLAIVIFAIVFMAVGRQITAPVVDKIQAGSAAEAAGFEIGDRIVSIDGQKVNSFGDMQRIVSVASDVKLGFIVRRKGKTIAFSATPRRREIKDRFGNVHRIGLLGISRRPTKENITVEKFGPLGATVEATRETWFVIVRTLDYVYGIIIGREKADQLGGPLRIAQMSGQVATISFVALLNLVAVLSVSIGLINLFPIPMLDGGHLLYFMIEVVRGKPLSDRAQNVGFRLGLAAVIMLMIFATWNDLVHFNVF